MLIELAVTIAFLVGGIVGFAANNTEKEPGPKVNVKPELWQPVDHTEMLKQCGYQCQKAGKGMKSYSPFSGECECLGE